MNEKLGFFIMRRSILGMVTFLSMFILVFFATQNVLLFFLRSSIFQSYSKAFPYDFPPQKSPLRSTQTT